MVRAHTDKEWATAPGARAHSDKGWATAPCARAHMDKEWALAPGAAAPSPGGELSGGVVGPLLLDRAPCGRLRLEKRLPPLLGREAARHPAARLIDQRLRRRKHAPDARAAILGCGDETFAVGTEGGAAHRLRALDHRNGPARADVPDARRVVGRRRHKPRAVRAVGDAVGRTLMARECCQQPPGIHVP